MPVGVHGCSSDHNNPPKLKFLLGHHLTTNSWFRETFLKSHQLQNFRHYGDQNGHNLEGCIKRKIQAEKSRSKISVYLPGHVTAVELYRLCLDNIMKITAVKTRLVQITT